MTELISTGITVKELTERRLDTLNSLFERLGHLKDLLKINRLSNSDELKMLISIIKGLRSNSKNINAENICSALADILETNMYADLDGIRKASKPLLDNCYAEVLPRYEKSLNDYIDLLELNKEKENREYLFKIQQDLNGVISYNKKIEEVKNDTTK